MAQIQISDKYWEELNSAKKRGDTFEDVIKRDIKDGREHYFKLEEDYLKLVKEFNELKKKMKVKK